jgi:hypothetical protein
MIVEWPFHMNLFQNFNIFANSFWNRGQRIENTLQLKSPYNPSPN